MLKVPTRLLLHSREETGVASIDRIAFWCVPNQYQRTKCRFNEDPLVGPKRKSVGVFVCPFLVKSRHSALQQKMSLFDHLAQQATAPEGSAIAASPATLP